MNKDQEIKQMHNNKMNYWAKKDQQIQVAQSMNLAVQVAASFGEITQSNVEDAFNWLLPYLREKLAEDISDEEVAEAENEAKPF